MDVAHRRENAIRRLFAEGLKCCPDFLQNFNGNVLGVYGDPAGLAKADILDCKNEKDIEKCLKLKYLVGYTVLVLLNVIEHCQKDLSKILKKELKNLEDDLLFKLRILDNMKCPQNCEDILKIFDELINNYILDEKNNFILEQCCNK